MTRQCQHLITSSRPVKAMSLKTLVPEHEAVALPHQDLELITSRVDEREHRPREWILSDDIPRQNRKSIDLPAHVHRCAMQKDALDGSIRPQHPLAPRAPPPRPPSVPATRHTRWRSRRCAAVDTPDRCLQRPSGPASSLPERRRNDACACAVGPPAAVHLAGAAPQSHRTPAAAQTPLPWRTHSATHPLGVPPQVPPPLLVASASASRPSCTSLPAGYTARSQLTTEERPSLSAYNLGTDFGCVRPLEGAALVSAWRVLPFCSGEPF